MNKDKVKKIIQSLAEDGMTVSETDLTELLSKNNQQVAGMLGRLAEKVSTEQETESKKKTDSANTYKKIEKKESLFNNSASSKSSLAEYNRSTQLATQVPDKLLDQIVAAKQALKDLSDQVAGIEIDNPDTGDDQYTIVSEGTETTWLHDIQNSIGAFNEYSKKYRVTKKLKDKGQPSLDLTSTLI